MTDEPERLLIDGAWRPGAAGERRDSWSPASGERLGRWEVGTPADVDAAVTAARRAQPGWAATSPFERAEILHAAARELRARQDAVARLLSLENGKPLIAEAMVEVEWAARQLDEAAEWAVRVEGQILPSASPSKRILVRREPIGVVGVITPWNHPLMIACEYLGPALATGNAVVWSPSSTVVLCSMELARCLVAAGVPAGILNVVPGPGADVGGAIAGDPRIDLVGLTGSTMTGASVARRAAGRRLLAELGGNGPTIVLDDADVDRAALGIAAGAFANAGQSCSATELVLAHSTVRAALVERVAAHARAIVLGDPLAAATTMGPLHKEQVAVQVEGQVARAIAAGARLVTGGHMASGHPTTLYWEPTVVDEVTAEMELAREETFGPVVPVVSFDTIDDALGIAEASGYGLIAAVFGEDLRRAMAVAERVRAGIVNVNDTSDYWELHVPFGGASGTGSGVGRIGGRWMAEQLTEPRTLIVETSTP